MEAEGRHRRGVVAWFVPGVVPVVVLSVVLAACSGGLTGASNAPIGGGPGGSGSIPSVAPDAPATPPVADPALPDPSGAPPSPLASAGSRPLDGLIDAHADPELEGRLPAWVGTQPMSRFSLTGAEATGSTGDALADLLAGLGRPPSDLSVAVALDPSGRLGGSVSAYRVRGLDPGTLRLGLATLLQLGGAGALPTPTTVAGKEVIDVTLGPSMPEGLRALPHHYLYTAGDAVYVIHGSAEAAVAILELLP